MVDRISKTQRWLDLIALLVGRRMPVEVDQIMEGVPGYAERYLEGSDTDRETVRRMFERDKDELREYGIPIETVDMKINYGDEAVKAYRLQSRDFYLPYLRLVTESGAQGPSPSPLQKSRYGMVELRAPEMLTAYRAVHRMAAAPSFPFRSEAGAALRKLSFDLDEASDLLADSPVLYVDRPRAAEVRDRLRVLSGALAARKRVTFSYHGIERGQDTERDVAPYGLLFQKGHWYLVGHDKTRGDLRVFRVGRMEEPMVNRKSPKQPDYEIPADFSLDAYRDRDAWELGDEEAAIAARVRFEFPTSLWAERNGFGSPVESLPDGSQVRGFEVRQVSPFLRWVLSLEGKAAIVEPASLRTELATLAREVLAVYTAPGDGRERVDD